MADEIKRYRVRPKTYLCLTPQEALASGITIGEETVEELTLADNPGFRTREFAVVRKAGADQLRDLSVEARQETLFEGRAEALEFIKNNGPEVLRLYGVISVRTVPRDEIRDETKDQPIEDILSELKSFEIK